MAINFDALPQSKPAGNLLPAGFYKATISKAEMKTPKNGGNDYLALTLDCVNAQGQSGKVWDNLYDSDKELVRYKLKRFIDALRLPLSGTFELKDLCKVVTGKQLVVDVGVDEKSDRPRNQVEVFKNDLYYPINEWAALTGAVTGTGDVPFEMSDAAPAPISARDSIDSVVEDTDDVEY